MKRITLILVVLAGLLLAAAMSALEEAQADDLWPLESYTGAFQKVPNPDPYEYTACGPFHGTGYATTNPNKCQGAMFNNGEYLVRDIEDQYWTPPMYTACGYGDVRLEGEIWLPNYDDPDFAEWEVTVGFGDKFNNWYVCYIPNEQEEAWVDFDCELPGTEDSLWAYFGVGGWRNGATANYVPVGYVDVTMYCTDEDF